MYVTNIAATKVRCMRTHGEEPSPPPAQQTLALAYAALELIHDQYDDHATASSSGQPAQLEFVITRLGPSLGMDPPGGDDGPLNFDDPSPLPLAIAHPGYAPPDSGGRTSEYTPMYIMGTAPETLRFVHDDPAAFWDAVARLDAALGGSTPPP